MDQYVELIEAGLDQAQADVPVSKYAQSVTQPITEQKSADSIRFDELWNAFILIAENQLTTDDETKLNRLASLVRGIKDLGTLKVQGQPVETNLGVAWIDLPYLGAQMREAWNASPPQSSTEQWTNLNGFAARLTANDSSDFSLYAIWSLRDSLETPRPFTERDSGEGDAQPKDDAEASIDELLPGALQWFEYCGDKMVALSIQSHIYTKPGQSNDPARLGTLAQENGIMKGGYSVRRWQFWKKRLEEISRARDDAGGREKIAKLAYQGAQRMSAIDKELMVMVEDMDGLHGARTS